MEGEVLKTILGAGRDIPWPALTVISFLVSAYLYRAQQTCSNERIREMRDLITAMERGTASNQELASNIRERATAIQEVARLQAEQPRLIEAATVRVLERLDLICRNLNTSGS